MLCDEQLYREVIAALGDAIDPHVLMSPMPQLEDSAADILSRAPARFALVGTSYGDNLAMEVALAAPERVTALWLMGCHPAAPAAGGPDLAGGLEATPDAVFDMPRLRPPYSRRWPSAWADRPVPLRLGQLRRARKPRPG